MIQLTTKILILNQYWKNRTFFRSDLKCSQEIVDSEVADPRFPKVQIIWPIFSQKLHANERNWPERIHQCSVYSQIQCLFIIGQQLEKKTLLPPANDVFEGYVFTRACQSFCSQGGGGVDVQVIGTPPHTHKNIPSSHPPGRYTPLAGTFPRQVHPPGRYTLPATVHAGIRSTSGRYASHWNAFLFN